MASSCHDSSGNLFIIIFKCSGVVPSSHSGHLLDYRCRLWGSQLWGLSWLSSCLLIGRGWVKLTRVDWLVQSEEPLWVGLFFSISVLLHLAGKGWEPEESFLVVIRVDRDCQRHGVCVRWCLLNGYLGSLRDSLAVIRTSPLLGVWSVGRLVELGWVARLL